MYVMLVYAVALPRQSCLPRCGFGNVPSTKTMRPKAPLCATLLLLVMTGAQCLRLGTPLRGVWKPTALLIGSRSTIDYADTPHTTQVYHALNGVVGRADTEGIAQKVANRQE